MIPGHLEGLVCACAKINQKPGNRILTDIFRRLRHILFVYSGWMYVYHPRISSEKCANDATFVGHERFPLEYKQYDDTQSY